MIINNFVKNGGGSGSGSTVSWQQSVTAGTQIARITIDGTSQNVYAPEGGSGSSVSYSQTLSAGTEVGQITIDGSATTIYAPTPETYVLPTAAANTLGGVKIGNGLSIDANGVLSTKVVALSQAEYDALVQAGTVDANTLYVII